MASSVPSTTKSTSTSTTSTSRRRVGLHVRCTPAPRNVHCSNCAQKAQIQTSRDGHSVFTVTFRCPKPKNGAPALFTEQQVRAAKIRFILLWLPALRGSSAHQYAAYVAEFENVYRSKGHDVGIGRLLEKQRRLMKRKVAESSPEFFRSTQQVAAFMAEASSLITTTEAPNGSGASILVATSVKGTPAPRMPTMSSSASTISTTSTSSTASLLAAAARKPAAATPATVAAASRKRSRSNVSQAAMTVSAASQAFSHKATKVEFGAGAGAAQARAALMLHGASSSDANAALQSVANVVAARVAAGAFEELQDVDMDAELESVLSSSASMGPGSVDESDVAPGSPLSHVSVDEAASLSSGSSAGSVLTDGGEDAMAMAADPLDGVCDDEALFASFMVDDATALGVTAPPLDASVLHASRVAMPQPAPATTTPSADLRWRKSFDSFNGADDTAWLEAAWQFDASNAASVESDPMLAFDADAVLFPRV